MKFVARITTLAAVLLFASTAFAQSGQPFGSPSQSEPATPPPAQQQAEQKVSTPAFHAGDIDILLGFGLGGLAYPHIEPSIDIGIIPLTDDFSISLGGGVDLGWCLLCAALDAASDVEFSSSYIKPYGRALFHLGTIGGLLDKIGDDFSLDLHGGIMGGPSFYSLRLADETGSQAAIEQTSTSVVLGPLVGARVGLADNTFLLFLEYRFLIEAGLDQVTFTDANGNTTEFQPDTFNQDGSSVLFGVGFRI